MMRRHHAIALAAAALLVLSLPAPARAQQILLDKPVRAGELVLYPDLNDQTKYYYVNDKPHLATDQNGRPQFSFLRYVENVRGTGDTEAPREGEGGGIVHALVSLSVTPEQRQTAQRELQRTKPGATIEGPVVFRAGKFGLVSSFKDPSGNLSSQVLGLGNAPLLDGEKASVSIQLTKLGAKILWESFQTPTPDISFSFEMDVDGYRSPIRATIAADWEQIYSSQAFGVGVASTYLAAEIRGAFEDLTRKGAIKVTQIGSDASMEAALNTAYNKLLEIMFTPINGTGTPSLSSLAGAAGGQTSLLDRATSMLAANRKEEAATAAKTTPATTTTKPAGGQTPAGTAAAKPAGAQPPSGSAAQQTTAGAQQPPGAAQQAMADTAKAEVPLQQRGKATVPADAPAPGTVSHEEGTAREAKKPAQQAAGKQSSKPAIAVVAVFEMKRIRQRGIFNLNLEKYTTDKETLRFDENIGDLRSLMADGQHFRQVNLDDPLYRQREIAVLLDGLNAADFGQYVNFVTAQMRKRHQGGDQTLEEVRIDRNNFNKQGNRFALLYGWKGDNDRARWFDYEFRPVWSFFGGVTVEGDWLAQTADTITLVPPFQRRSVDLQASPETVTKEGIRAITVKIFYPLGTTERTVSTTLNTTKNVLSGKLDFMLPADKTEYAYEIVWQMSGNRTRSSGRQTGSSSVLFVDEMPGT